MMSTLLVDFVACSVVGLLAQWLSVPDCEVKARVHGSFVFGYISVSSQLCFL